jgi:hypothetical protein
MWRRRGSFIVILYERYVFELFIGSLLDGFLMPSRSFKPIITPYQQPLGVFRDYSPSHALSC